MKKFIPVFAIVSIFASAAIAEEAKKSVSAAPKKGLGHVYQTCKEDIQKLCKQGQTGGFMLCLEQNSESVSVNCKTAMAEHKKFMADLKANSKFKGQNLTEKEKAEFKKRVQDYEAKTAAEKGKAETSVKAGKEKSDKAVVDAKIKAQAQVDSVKANVDANAANLDKNVKAESKKAKSTKDLVDSMAAVK